MGNNRVKIALLGGGYTLQRVAQLLDPQDFVITSRDPARCTAWRAQGWQAQRVAIEDRESLEALFKTFISIERVVDSVPPLHGVEDPTLGVTNLVSAVEDCALKIARIVYLSTTGVFGVRDGSEVDEHTPPAPWNEQGEARWLSEQAYDAAGLPFTALRLPAIYGFDRGVAQAIRSGSYRLVNGGSFWTNRIHVDDLASIIVAALRAESLPKVLCVADDEPTKAINIAQFVCAREGLPLPRSISADEVIKRGGYSMVSNQRIKNTLMKELLGITLRYRSYREGLYQGDSK